MSKKNTLKRTQREIAEEIGVHAVHLNAVLRGRSRPSASLALRIEQATGGAVTRMELLYPDERTAPGE